MFILIGLSFLTDHILARLASNRAHRWFVGIGIIVHEYSHAIACWLTGTKVYEIKLFEKTGGEVRHQKRNYFIMSIIAIAPLFGGILMIILLSYLFGMVGVQFHREFLDLKPAGFLEAFFALMVAAGYTFYLNLSFSITIVFFILYLYFIGSITAVLAPSTHDLKNAAIGLVILLLLGLLVVYTQPLSYIPGFTDYFNTPTPGIDFIISWLSRGIAIGIIAVLIFLIPLLIMLALKRK